jgi:very-short-patch-repair endonuclease
MLRNTKRTLIQPKIAFARELRKDLTPGEKVLWKSIRRKKFHGLKFRRQAPIGPYIVDFLCVEKKLIIEIDGDSHYEPGAQERDRKREAYLRGQGFNVLRVGNRQTVDEIESVLLRMMLMLGYPVD